MIISGPPAAVGQCGTSRLQLGATAHRQGAGLSNKSASFPSRCGNAVVSARPGKRARFQGPTRACIIRHDGEVLRHGAVAPCGACARASHRQGGKRTSGFVGWRAPELRISINGLRQFRSSRRLAYSRWGAQLGAHNERLRRPPPTHCPSSNALGQSAVLGTEALARLGLRLGSFQPMLQSSQFDGVAFDPLSFQKDGLASAEVDVGRCQIL